MFPGLPDDRLYQRMKCRKGSKEGGDSVGHLSVFSAVNELLLHAGVDCSISLEKPHWEEVDYTIFSGVCVCVRVSSPFLFAFYSCHITQGIMHVIQYWYLTVDTKWCF